MSIKNGDLPAMPAIMLSEVESNSGLKYELKTECAGLTKREQFAMAAMQGILSGFSTADIANESKRSGIKPDIMIACMAAEMADALLAELERTK